VVTKKEAEVSESFVCIVTEWRELVMTESPGIIMVANIL